MQSGGAEGDSKRVIENHDIETTRDRHVDPHARDSLRRGTHGSYDLQVAPTSRELDDHDYEGDDA
jgi:hypothetical protein